MAGEGENIDGERSSVELHLDSAESVDIKEKQAGDRILRNSVIPWYFFTCSPSQSTLDEFGNSSTEEVDDRGLETRIDLFRIQLPSALPDFEVQSVRVELSSSVETTG